jgi:hypothetical protein
VITKNILNVCFSYSEYNNFDSDDKKTAGLLLVLQSMLFSVPNSNPIPG